MIERTGMDSRMRKLAGSALSPGTIGLMATRYDVPGHAGTVMLLVEEGDLVEPFLRERAGPAGDQRGAPARRECSATPRR